MRQIKFMSLHGQTEVDVPDIGKRFKHGESQPVTDEQAEILLTNPNFVEEAPQKYGASSFADPDEE